MRLPRFGAAFSVRTRLIVLAFVPVVGFAAISLAYVSSEQAVDAAFASVQQSSRLADASRVFKESLTTMQARAKDFVAQPQPTLVTRFQDAHDAAIGALGTITELSGEAEKQTLTALQGRVANLKGSFTALVAEQDELGLTEFEGIQGSLRDGGNAMERIVHEDMSWLSPKDQRAILTPLMLMRRYEVEYRLTRADPIHSAFNQELVNFEKAFAAVIAADIMKAQLTDQVKLYTAAFKQWMESTGKIARGIAIISAETRQMLPAADEIIAAAGQRATHAADGVAASQQQTKMLIIGIGVAVVLIGLLLNWLIGRGITGPLARLSGAMERLATGDTSVDIPATDAKDEIGAMARTVIVFRDNALEREQLAVDAGESGARARAAHRDDRRDDRRVRGHDRRIARQAARRGRTAGDRVRRAQQRGRCGFGAVERRRGAGRRGLDQRGGGGDLGRRARRLDRRDRRPGGDLDRGRKPRGLRGAAHGRDHVAARRRRDAHRRGDRADPGDRRPDQPARAQRHDRGGARRRGRTRLRGGGLGGEEPREPDRQGDRGRRHADRRDPVGRRRRGDGDRAGQHHHLRKCPASRRASPPRWKSRTPRSRRSRRASTAPRARRAPAPRR